MEDLEFLTGKNWVGGVSIIVGQNGAGKSSYLRKLAEHGHAQGINTLIICNTPFDSLGPGKPRKKISARSGTLLPERILKSVITGTYRQSKSRASGVGAVLDYCGYSTKVTVACRDVDLSNLDDALRHRRSTMSTIAYDEFSVSARLLEFTKELQFDLAGGVTERFTNSYTFKVLKSEKELKSAGIVSSIDILLHRKQDGAPVAVGQASSGQLSLISTLCFLMTKIQKRSLILIDEPENSLHPQWQREYVDKIYSVLYLYEPKIFIATHAPMIVSGARSSEIEIEVKQLHGENEKPQAIDIEHDGLEETMWDVFGTITPESHFLSEQLVQALALLKRGERRLEDVQELIERLRLAVYDKRQHEVLGAAEALSKRIAGDAPHD
ncbi:AAA family ATPase [Dyella silvae]|uniref:AAA family ATPase n=1 Tax=Dyella silvae TaxID=2994424 RepID=UPI002265384B|nr:AAA family ATPase [Dyella silvae]